METLIKEMTQDLLRENPENDEENQHVDHLIEYILSRIDITKLLDHPEDSREVFLGGFECKCLEDIPENHESIEAIFKVLKFVTSPTKWLEKSEEEKGTENERENR